MPRRTRRKNPQPATKSTRRRKRLGKHNRYKVRTKRPDHKDSEASLGGGGIGYG